MCGEPGGAVGFVEALRDILELDLNDIGEGVGREKREIADDEAATVNPAMVAISMALSFAADSRCSREAATFSAMLVGRSMAR